MNSSVLKEYLIKLGFSVREDQFRRFNEIMQATGKRFVEIGKTSLAATGIMGASLEKIGSQLEGLYYAAQRTGASAGELQSFAFAASQIGVSAEQAKGAIEGLAAARRMNPGLNGMLGGMGIDPRQTDNAKVLLQLLIRLRGMPYYQGAQIAQMFGINEQTFQMLERGLPEMQRYLAMRERMFRAAGINPADMANRSHEFMVHWRTMEAAVGNLADIIAYRLMPWGKKVIDWLTGVVTWLMKADRATDGWSSKLLGLASALAGGSIVKGGLGLLGKMFGRGAAGAGIAAAGEGATEAGGAGLLATVGLPAIIIAAVGAALVWMMVHKDQVRQAVGNAWESVKDTAHIIGEGAKASGGYFKMLQMQGGPLGDLARMVGKFEGFRDKIYRDIAGNRTFGFGHKLGPGESVAGLNPITLFMQDLQRSLWAVSRNVKSRLTDNQRKALADLEFNIGEKAFRDSTLVRKLNAGDYEGAADQFARWNKVLVDGHKVANATLSQRRAAEAQLFRTPDSTTLNLQTSIKIEDGGNARETARETAREQNRVYGNIVRNFTPATQ